MAWTALPAACIWSMTSSRIVINDINAFFTALQADLHIRNDCCELFCRGLIDQAQMVVDADFSMAPTNHASRFPIP